MSARYEELFEQPATEEAIWRAAALYRLHGAVFTYSYMHDTHHSLLTPYIPYTNIHSFQALSARVPK